jgi:hypothetical protein
LSEKLCKVFPGEVTDAGARLSPQRNGEDLLALQQLLGYFRLYVAEERVQRSEAMIPRADRNVPVVSQVIKECLDQGYVDLRQRQTLQCDSPHVATESQQQGKDVALSLDRVGAQVALGSQMVRQEAGHEH